MMNNQPTYRFYVETHTDYIEWDNLTFREAKAMYKYTDAHQPSNVKGYGWEEVRPLVLVEMPK